jgi:hypothetical protein
MGSDVVDVVPWAAMGVVSLVEDGHDAWWVNGSLIGESLNILLNLDAELHD